jgi:Flp pilus assembly protein TadD
LPGGTHVRERLRHEIDSCQAFLPVLSSNAFGSGWVAHEVAYAIQRQSEGVPLKIVPIISTKLPINPSWPKPFDWVPAVRWRLADFESLDIENLVVDLCRDLGVDYQPLLPPHDRLPYRERFLQEIQEAYRTERAKPRRTERERAVFEVLMRLLGEFGAAVRAERNDDALRTIRLFCLTCEHEYPALRLYYPYVARGAWELQTGDFQAAERTFTDLLQRPEVDESTFGALGQVSLERGEHEQALAYFRRACECCPSDPATVSNEILARILCGLPIDLNAALAKLDHLSPSLGRDSDHVQEVKARAFKNAGKPYFVQAEQLYRDLVRRGVATYGVLTDYAELLRVQRRYKEALELLRPYAHDRADTNLVIEAARLAEQCRCFDEAERMWCLLLDREPMNWRFVLELALVYWHCGHKERAKQVLAALLTDEARLPQTAEDFYCLGAAQWLCGDRSLAEYDFQRSRFASSLYYARVFT